MRMYDLIQKKRDGGILTETEIRFLVDGVVDGSIPDYQLAAMMKMCIRDRGTPASAAAAAPRSALRDFHPIISTSLSPAKR